MLFITSRAKEEATNLAECFESKKIRARLGRCANVLAAIAFAILGSGCSGAEDLDDYDDYEDLGTHQSGIIGGVQAKPGEFPFFVQGNRCGASLIWPDIALTAAHCKGAFKNVIVGGYRYNSVAHGALRRRVTKQVAHPKYNAGTNKYDFMVLKLAVPVQNSSQRLIKFNKEARFPENNALLTVIGFGATNRPGTKYPDILRKVNVRATPHERCNKAYGGWLDKASMLCATVQGGRKDSCYGDSGGPLFNQKGVQVGVVSFGADCADPHYPGVYSRVSGASRWIQNKICQMSANPPASCK